MKRLLVSILGAMMASIVGAILTILVLTGSEAKSPSELIIGEWYSENSGSGMNIFPSGSVIIFFEIEPTGEMARFKGTWSISEETFQISNLYEPASNLYEPEKTAVMKIEELTKEHLVLCTEESGETETFIKVN